MADNHRPCRPWISNEIPEEFHSDDIFVDKSVILARNYCRNPTADLGGPYCFAKGDGNKIEKRYCDIRNCKATDCRRAGTGNDYIGELTVTRYLIIYYGIYFLFC